MIPLALNSYVPKTAKQTKYQHARLVQIQFVKCEGRVGFFQLYHLEAVAAVHDALDLER